MRKISLSLILTSILLILSSCGKQDLRRWSALINSDGTCTSEIILDGKTISQKFSPEMELSEQKPWDIDGVRINSKASYKKTFHWFYTEYTFTQTFESLGNKFPVSPDSIGNKDIISYWFTGRPNIMAGLTGSEAALKMRTIEPLVDKWITDNVFEIIFSSYVHNYDSISNPPLTKEKFLSTHDAAAAEFARIKKNNKNYDAQASFRDFYKTEAYNVFSDDTPFDKEINKRLADCFSILNINIPYQVKMPGIICGGIDIAISDNTATFYISGEKLIPGDYTISATSRTINLWAIFISILVIAFAFVSLRRYRRRQ